MAWNLSRLLFVSAFAIAAPTSAQSAPALGEKPTKWEFAELSYWCGRTPPPPGQPMAAARESLVIQWTTADQLIKTENWDDLADKLKIPSLKEAGTSGQRKLRLLNRLVSDGWEIVEHERPTIGGSGTESWTFKRRVP